MQLYDENGNKIYFICFFDYESEYWYYSTELLTEYMLEKAVEKSEKEYTEHVDKMEQMDKDVKDGKITKEEYMDYSSNSKCPTLDMIMSRDYNALPLESDIDRFGFF